MNSSNHILSHDQKFKAYLAGTLSQEEVISLEKELENNPFYKDAFEGYKLMPESVNSLVKLEASKNIFMSSSFTTGFYTFFLLLFFSLGVFFIFKLNKAASIALTDVSEVPVKAIENRSILIKPKPIQELTDENIDESVFKEEEKQVLYENIAKDHKVQILDTLAVAIDTRQKESLIKVTQKPPKEIKDDEPQELVTESVPLISIHGLINVNYSKIKNGILFKKTIVSLTGVPANIEEVPSEEPSHELKTIHIAYDKYLEDIQYYFSRNKFKKALKGYKQILKQHPDDINAHFYSALCYYNINQSAKSLEHLDIILQHQYDVFRQEGEWYKAQVLYDLGRKNEALLMLDKVIKRNDFYASQALEMTKEIK